MLVKKRFLYFFSFITTMILSFVPAVGIRVEGDYWFFGFPIQWFGYYGDGDFSFEVLALIVNFFIFYFILLLLNKILKKVIQIYR